MSYRCLKLEGKNKLWGEKTLKTKFGLGITVIKKKKKPDTLEFNSKENLPIVNEFTPSTGYCLALCLFSCSSEASLLPFHCFMGYGDSTEHHTMKQSCEQSVHSELGQSWSRPTNTAHRSHQHETDHMVIPQGFSEYYSFPSQANASSPR